MLRARFIAPCTMETLNDLKLAILYFDQVEIADDAAIFAEPAPGEVLPESGTVWVKLIVREVLPTVSDAFRQQVKSLEKQGVVSYVSPPSPETFVPGLEELADRTANSAKHALFKVVGTRRRVDGSMQVKLKAPREVLSVMQEALSRSRVTTEGIIKLYSLLLQALVMSLPYDVNVVTPSYPLHRFYRRIQSSLGSSGASPNFIHTASGLSFEALRVMVPDVSTYSFDDVLELKGTLGDELTTFRAHMSKTARVISETPLDAIELSDPRRIFESALRPSIVDLERKIRTSRLGILRKLCDQIRDPKAYTPLVASLVHQVPAQIAALVSLGIITTAAAIDYRREREEIKSNGLYYLLAVRSKLGRSSQT